MGLGVVVQHAIFVQSRGHRFHFEKYAAVLLLSFYDLSSDDGIDAGLVPKGSVSAGVGGVACKGFCLFQFAEQFDIGLVDLIVLFIKLMGEGSAFAVFDLLQMGESIVIEM